MHVCMFICMYVCIYVCMYVYMYVCIYVYMYICMRQQYLFWNNTIDSTDTKVCLQIQRCTHISTHPRVIKQPYFFTNYYTLLPTNHWLHIPDHSLQLPDHLSLTTHSYTSPSTDYTHIIAYPLHMTDKPYAPITLDIYTYRLLRFQWECTATATATTLVIFYFLV